MNKLILILALFSGFAQAGNFILPDSTLIEGVEVQPANSIVVLDADLPSIKDGSKWRVGSAVVAKPSAAFDLVRAKADAVAATNDFHAYQMAARTGNPTSIMTGSFASKASLAAKILSAVTPDQFETAYLNAAGKTTAALRTAWATAQAPSATAYFTLLGKADGLKDTSVARINAATDAATLAAAITQNRADAAAFIAALPSL